MRGAPASVSRMPKTKRLPLSLRISEHAAHTLKQRTDREGHRYPAVLAASLLERALVAPAVQVAPDEPPAIAMLRGLAGSIGGELRVDETGVLLVTRPGTSSGAVEWLRSVLPKNPAFAGMKLSVLPGLGVCT